MKSSEDGPEAQRLEREWGRNIKKKELCRRFHYEKFNLLQ